MARRVSFEQLESRLMMRATPQLGVGCYLASTASDPNPIIPEAYIALYSPAGSASGIVTAKLANPAGAVIETETFTFAAQGVQYTHCATIPTVSGKYTWTVSYAGDALNKPVTSSASITVTVPTPPPPPPPPSTKPIGYQTFYQSSDSNSPSQLKSTQAYVRYDWSEVETAPGVFNFATMDRDYAAAEAAGQQFNFRIMPFEDGDTGPWGIQSLGGTQISFGGVAAWQPDLNLPAVQADLDKLLAAAGARYAANTATVDVGWWMPYGEWSNYNVNMEGPRPSEATTLWLVAEIKRYFPNSYAIVQEGIATDDPTTFKACLAAGTGVRWDSWHSKNSWQESEHLNSLSLIAATQQWKIAPMILEPWDTNSWNAADWAAAIDEAINTYHAWMWSTKGNAIPPSDMSLVNQLLSYEQGL